MCLTFPPCASGEECCFVGSPLSNGSAKLKAIRKRRSPDRPKSSSDTIPIRPENSAGDAGKDIRASKAFSTWLCAEDQARPDMGMDWKVLREWKGAIKSAGALCADDGRRCSGEAAGVAEPDQRD